MGAAAEQARNQLIRRIGELTGREEAIAKHLRGEDGRRDADFGDIANFTAADEVLEGLEDAALAELTEIRHALRRMDEGTWGKCASCGKAIAPKRLAAMPHASRCVSCAS